MAMSWSARREFAAATSMSMVSSGQFKGTNVEAAEMIRYDQQEAKIG